MDKNTQIIVLVVNILSLRKYHVKIGNVRYDMLKIRNLGPHTCPISAYASLTPYKKHRPVGRPYTRTARMGLAFHQSQTNWLLI